MPLDEHRAPNRLASMGPGRSTASQKSTPITAAKPTTRVTRRPERHVDIVDAEERPWIDEDEPQVPSPHGSGSYHIDKTSLSPTASEADFSDAAMTPEAPLLTGELSRQERYQMLMQAIQLYCDEWKLATIRSDSKTNRLVAFLVPRNKRIDLKTAMSKQQVMRILIDSRGNTDIQEPTRRGPFGSFTSWFRGS